MVVAEGLLRRRLLLLASSGCSRWGGCGGGKVEGRIFLKVDYFEALIKELGMKVDQCQRLYMWWSPLDRTYAIYSTVVKLKNMPSGQFHVVH